MASGDSTRATTQRTTKTDSVETWDDLINGGHAENIRERLQNDLAALLRKWRRRLRHYNVLVLYVLEKSLDDTETDQIYQALDNLDNRKKDLLLILVCNGGKIEPAYQISKLCRDWSKDKFVVAVPRRAKSAATLLALGADEVHMGPLGELGPIDPQFGWMPGLAIQDSLRVIVEMTEKHPRSAPVWAGIIEQKIPIEIIGYYERITESSVQYAKRLLVAGKSGPDRATKIANHLVYGYKDHSFVIDRDEAKEIFGDSVVVSSNELAFGEEAYRIISRIEGRLKAVTADHNNMVYGGVSMVGIPGDGVTLLPRRLKREGPPDADDESETD